MNKGLSIIITYYDGYNYIFNCIDSLLASFSNSKSKLKFEVILVVDSPNDPKLDNYKVFDKYYEMLDLTILKNEFNIGVSESRNKGLKSVKFNHFTIIDQDDLVTLNYFSVLENNINIFDFDLYIINANIRYTKSNTESKMFYFTPKFELESILFQNTNIITPALIIFNSNAVKTDGLFIETSEKYKGCDDWAAYLNILMKNNSIKYRYIEDVLFTYCYHDNNYSHNLKEMIFSSITVIDFFIKVTDKSNTKILNALTFARKRYEFLYYQKVKKMNYFDLIRYFSDQFFYQYFFSFFNFDRLSRLFYRLSRLKKNVFP